MKIFLAALGCLMLTACSTAPMSFNPNEAMTSGEKIVVGRFNFNFGSESKPVLICMEGITMCRQLDGADGDKVNFVRRLKAGETLKIIAFNRPPIQGYENFGDVVAFESLTVDTLPDADVTYIGDVSFKLSPVGEPSFRVFSSPASVDFLKSQYQKAGKPFLLRVGEKRIDPARAGTVRVITNSWCAGKILCRPKEFKIGDIKIEQK